MVNKATLAGKLWQNDFFFPVFRAQDITLSATQLDKTSVIVSLVVLATVLGNFLVSEIQDLVIKRPNRFVVSSSITTYRDDLEKEKTRRTERKSE